MPPRKNTKKAAQVVTTPQDQSDPDAYQAKTPLTLPQPQVTRRRTTRSQSKQGTVIEAAPPDPTPAEGQAVNISELTPDADGAAESDINNDGFVILAAPSIQPTPLQLVPRPQKLLKPLKETPAATQSHPTRAIATTHVVTNTGPVTESRSASRAPIPDAKRASSTRSSTLVPEDPDDWGPADNDPRDENFELEDEDEPLSDVDLEDSAIDLSEVEDVPKIVAPKPIQAVRKVGRPPKAVPVIPLVPIIFMLTVNGITKRIPLTSRSPLDDLRDEVATILRKRPAQLDLLYTTIWGKKSDRLELSSEEDWVNMIQYVIANLNKKKGSLYHVEIFDGIVVKDSKKSAKTKAIAQDADADETVVTRTQVLSRIQRKHYCNEHGYECYIVKDRRHEPLIKINSHTRIPRAVLLLWAADCVADREMSEDFVPEKYVPEVLGIERALSDVEEGPFVPPPPKPRGMTGSMPAPPPAPNPEPLQTTQPQLPQGPSSQMPSWNQFPYPPFMFPPLPSPYKQMYMGLANLERPTSPTRRYDRVINRDGPRLADWFEELDQLLGEDDETYLSLLPGMSQMGVQRVYDLTLFEPAEVETGTGCSKAMAKRVTAKATTFMEEIYKELR